MSKAAVIVKVILGETGEADQDYDHETFDRIVELLDQAGYPGARHREFDKYQGVYLFVPNVDRFWASYESGAGLALIPEDDPWKHEDGEVTEIPIDQGEDGVQIHELVHYINQRYASKFAQMRAQAAAEKFIDRTYKSSPTPRRGSTRRGA